MNVSRLLVWQQKLLGWAVAVVCLASVAIAGDPPRYPDRTNLLVYINEDGSETPVTTLEQWEKRRHHILQNMAKVFGELPGESERCDLDVRVEEIIETPSYVRKKITYRPRIGCRVEAYLFIPRLSGGKCPAMLCLHPSGKHGILEPAGIEGRSPGLYHHAKDLAELGYVTLAPSFYATTDSGEPYNPYEHGYGSWMGGMAVWNHMRAIDLLQSFKEVDPEKIGSIGHSLGCLNTLFLAALDQRIKVLACSAGVTSFEKHKTARDPLGKLTVWNQYDYFPRIETDFDRVASKVPFDFPEILGAIAPRPIIISAPMGDYMNPLAALDCVSAAVPVYQLYRTPKTISLILPPGGHALPAWVQNEMYAFIDREFDFDRQK